MPDQNDLFDPRFERQAALDNVLSTSTDQIRFHPFENVRRGYDPEAVRSYLATLASWFDALKSRVRALEQARPHIAADAPVTPTEWVEPSVAEEPRVDPYEEMANRVAGVIRAADEYAREAKSRAEDERTRSTEEAGLQAERAIAEARTEADRIVSLAEETADQRLAAANEEVARLERKAEEVLAEARAEAEMLTSDLGPRRESILEQLRTLRASLAQLTNEVDTHLGSLDKGPGTDWSVEPDLDLDGMADLDLASEGAEVAEASEDEVDEVTIEEESVSIRSGVTEARRETQSR